MHSNNFLATQVYPPRSSQDLKALFEQIISSNAQDHHKYSLVYYLLKDLKLKERDAITFSKAAYIPERYTILIDGLWLVDRLLLKVRLTVAHERF
jgi:hypothetical protein